MARAPTNADKPRLGRRWFRFRLRTLLVVVALVGACAGWFGIKLQQAREQRDAVAAIRKIGGFAFYDYQVTANDEDQTVGVSNDAPGPAPAWLENWLGRDFFSPVVLVNFALHKPLPQDESPVDDESIAVLQKLDQLEWLALYHTGVTDAGLVHLATLTDLGFLGLDSTRITDAGLVHLHQLDRLELLTLRDTNVTEEGVERLQEKLPNCELIR